MNQRRWVASMFTANQPCAEVAGLAFGRRRAGLCRYVVLISRRGKGYKLINSPRHVRLGTIEFQHC